MVTEFLKLILQIICYDIHVNNCLKSYFTSLQKTREEWLSVFFIAASIYVFGCLVYIIFGSAELEPWAKEKQKTKEASVIT